MHSLRIDFLYAQFRDTVERSDPQICKDYISFSTHDILDGHYRVEVRSNSSTLFLARAVVWPSTDNELVIIFCSGTVLALASAFLVKLLGPREIPPADFPVRLLKLQVG